MRHALRLAHHGDHHIGLLRRRDRFVDHFLRRAWVNLHRVLIQIEEIDNAFVIGNVRPFGVNHFAVIAQRFFDAGQDGHRLVGHPGRGPAAHHVALAVRQRAHHRDSAGFFSGSVSRRFFSSTRLSRATSRASLRCRRLSALVSCGSESFGPVWL